MEVLFMSDFSVDKTFLLYCLGMEVVLGCLVEYIFMSVLVYTLHGYTVHNLISGHFSQRNSHIIGNKPVQ